MWRAPAALLATIVLSTISTLTPSEARATPDPPRVSLWRQAIVALRQLVSAPPIERERPLSHWLRLTAWELATHASTAGPSLHTSLHQLIALALANATQTQSVGRPQCGYLADPVQLPEHPAFHRRRPELAWGTKATVVHVVRAIQTVQGRVPRAHPLAVGDLSAERGGPLVAHRSHQSGRDVDLGLYYLDPPPAVPHRFVRATTENLDREATWNLLTALAQTTGRPGGVEYILLDHGVQQLLFEWALEHGVSKQRLARILQYPRPPDSPVGLVRHFAKHDDHLHVRFACPPDDALCIPH